VPDPIAKPWLAVHGTKMKTLTIPSPESAKGCLAQPRRLLQQRIENRREVAGRGIDNLEHLSGRGLLRLRLIAFGVALSKLTLEIGDGLLRIV